MELGQALAESCDTYFYQVGQRFYDLPSSRGHDAAALGVALRVRLATPASTSAPRTPGLVPTPDWRCRHFGGPPCAGYVDRIWKPGYEVQLAIGQGDLEVTPMQMARFYAMIANGGQMVTPHIAQDVEPPTGDPGQPDVLRVLATQQATPSGVDPAALQAVQQGLWLGDALASTAPRTACSASSRSRSPGKTGTAEKDVRLPGYPNAGEAEPVLVVRVRPHRQPVDRRLRGDRERRPRRHGGGPGGAARCSRRTSRSTA